MKTLSSLFFKGIATILPITVTISILWWLGEKAHILVSQVLKYFFGENIRGYHPWMGVVVGIGFVLVVGLLMNAWIISSLVNWAESLIQRIPLVKTLYGSVRDLMGFFAGSEKKPFNQVVMVQIGDSKVRVLGLVTREDFSDLPSGIGAQDTVAVYMPMSYQLGGFTALVPRSAIQPVDMTMEEAMRFAVTAGMSKN